MQAMTDEFPVMPKGWAQYEEDYYRACTAAWQREKADRLNRLSVSILVLLVILVLVVGASALIFVSVH